MVFIAKANKPYVAIYRDTATLLETLGPSRGSRKPATQPQRLNFKSVIVGFVKFVNTAIQN
jgi:hypothetical protein